MSDPTPTEFDTITAAEFHPGEDAEALAGERMIQEEQPPTPATE